VFQCEILPNNDVCSLPSESNDLNCSLGKPNCILVQLHTTPRISVLYNTHRTECPIRLRAPHVISFDRAARTHTHTHTHTHTRCPKKLSIFYRMTRITMHTSNIIYLVTLSQLCMQIWTYNLTAGLSGVLHVLLTALHIGCNIIR